jgi:hypothetical protein
MLFNANINVDGSIDVEKVGILKKYELWSYIYYLYYFNNKTLNEFKAMRTEKNGKANAELFYNSVLATTSDSSVDNNTLIYFINLIVHNNVDNLINPVIDYLKKILSKEIIPSLGSISVKTGTNSKNVNIITNANAVKNANVKVLVSRKN